MNIKEKIFDTNKLTEPETEFYLGVKGIEVNLVDYPKNPYKNIMEMTLATWGSKINKWGLLSPEERFKVVKLALKRKALPLGLESPTFLFSIDNVSRSSFDQIARQRIGSTFSSIGWNNVHTKTGIRVPREISDNPTLYRIFKKRCEDIKVTYYDLISSGISWQSARAILPMSLLHKFYFSVNFMSLVAFCGRRLCFSEQEDTVATAWLMRERIIERFPFLGKHLRPPCDYSKKCNFQTGDTLPEEMGALFSPCGRNKCKCVPNIEFNLPCSDRERIMSDLKIYIPKSDEDFPVKEYIELSIIDKELFNAD